jgi:hypothetical protein
MSTMPTTTSKVPTRNGSRVSAGLLRAYPTLRQAARMIGVTASTLSRRSLRVEQAGREKRLSPRTVLELAAYYRKRDEYEVGGALVEYALEHAEEHVTEVEAEVDAFLRETADRDAPLEAERFLAEARRMLPDQLYERVERAYRAGAPGGAAKAQ